MILKSAGIACVYWIHKPDHTDIYTQGYIGVSTNPDKRWRQHKTDSKCNRHANNYLNNAITKYGDTLVYEVIFGGTLEQCYSYERELRPKPSIGWNLMSGGEVGKITEEGRRKIAEAAKNRVLTEYEKETRRLERYRRDNGYITRPAYRDMLAIKAGKVPPSKLSIPIFSVLQNEVYPSIEEASKTCYHSPFEIYEICETKIGDWIYLKDL